VCLSVLYIRYRIIWSSFYLVRVVYSGKDFRVAEQVALTLSNTLAVSRMDTLKFSTSSKNPFRASHVS